MLDIVSAIGRSQCRGDETVDARWNGHFKGLANSLHAMIDFEWSAEQTINSDGCRWALVYGEAFSNRAFRIRVQLRQKPIPTVPYAERTLETSN